ncbi:MAG: hypothetical protein M3N28_08925, partial [Actinomycetota bacterium]|nr:hypothetical protein [Actinomycetota bacterium]
PANWRRPSPRVAPSMVFISSPESGTGTQRLDLRGSTGLVDPAIGDTRGRSGLVHRRQDSGVNPEAQPRMTRVPITSPTAEKPFEDFAPHEQYEGDS